MKSVLSLLIILLVVSSHQLCAQEVDDTATTTPTSSSDVPYTVDKSELYLKDDMLFATSFMGSHGTDKNVVNGNTIWEISTININGGIQWGYFIFDRFAVGLGVNIGVDYTQFDDGDEDAYVDLFGGPFVRLYLVDKLYLEVLGGYGISNNKFESGNTVINTNYNGLYAMGGLGYDVFLNSTKDIALEFGANYVYKLIQNTQSSSDEIQSGGMRYKLGLVFYFF